MGFSAELYCRYASILYCSASAFCNLPVPPWGNRASRVNLHGLVAASCSPEHKHPMAPKTWCPQLVCWSAHKFVMLITDFLRYILPCSSHIWGFLSQWWRDVIICAEVFVKGEIFKVYVQAQYRWERIWSACLADLLKYSSTNLEKPRLFFWKIGMQRQIWSQRCRCIKHFSRGINVVLLHRLCCFSLQNPILLSEDICRKDKVVLGDSLQLFTVTYGTDSMHELKACKNFETTFAFN